MKTAIIGAGKMGQMIARQLIESKFCQPRDLCLSKGREGAIAELREQFPGSRATASNSEALYKAKLVFLCVRPQNFEETTAELQGALREDQLVISIVTGTSFAQLQEVLGTTSLVRCSTNIGIVSGNATSCWMVHKKLSDQDREVAQKIFAFWGDEIEAREEEYLEMAIVALGSGPAFVLEAEMNWIRAMLTVGMPRGLAERIGRSVFIRTATIANLNGSVSLSELQKQVLTPGGITLRMMHALDKEAFRFMVIAAFKAAYKQVQRFLKNKEDKE